MFLWTFGFISEEIAEFDMFAIAGGRNMTVAEKYIGPALAVFVRVNPHCGGIAGQMLP